MPVQPAFPGDVFPFGAHVYREPSAEMEEILADLPLLKRLGFTMIKVQESWAIDEPREGQYDLGRVERVIARAAELDLGVYVGLTMEQAPAWLWRRFPDCRLVYASGQPHDDPTQYLLPADGKPGPCWDHPGGRAAAERFIAALARRLGRFDNIWAWNTWQEIGFWPNYGGPLGFCYCPHTLARFRAWLQGRYHTLAALNVTWRTAYGAWEEIVPPRRDPAVPSFIDWRYFMDDVYITRVLEWKARVLRENDPRRRPVFSQVASPGVGSGAEWRWARTGDFFGNSNYPVWGRFHTWDDAYAQKSLSAHVAALYAVWDGIMLRGDLTRCAAGRERAFWGTEFQGGLVNTHLHMGRTPDAADIRRWTLAGLACGMHGISFLNHRAERLWAEGNGFGLLDARGETTPRIEEAGRIARAINADPALFSRGQSPRAQVALLVNEDLYHFCQGTANNAATLLSYNLRGHYARLWRLGIPVDFVDAAEVAAGALAGYRAAILAMPLALDPGYFAHLAAYVASGGTLISDACPGRWDGYGLCPRSQMVAGGEQLFGAAHATVRIVAEAGQSPRWTPDERTFGEFAPPTVMEGTGACAGLQLRTSFYLQTFTPTTGAPILLAGERVAGVAHASGRGQAILLGTFAGMCATAHTHPQSDALIERLLVSAGVQPDRHGPLLRRVRRLEGREAWFLINPTADEVSQNVDLEGFSGARDLLAGPLPVVDGRVAVTVPASSLSCLVLDGTRDR